MDKRYQVFVSSTYEDLKEEREKVIQALLELDCIPSGMELFPAADEDQWTLIKKVIDDCDYYIVIIGGRYGSIAASGTRYTQMEYEYALSKGKPILRFINRNPDSIPVSKADRSAHSRAKLEKFRQELKQKMCSYWESPDELGSKVKSSLIKLIKDKPAVGWIRGSESKQISRHEDKIEPGILEYLTEIRELLLSTQRVGSDASSQLNAVNQDKAVERLHNRKTLFISYSFEDSDFLNLVVKVAKKSKFEIITAKSLGHSSLTRDGVITLMSRCTHFLGIWTQDGGVQFEGGWIPSAWLLWELGAANALGLSWHLLVWTEIAPETWRRLTGEVPHTFFSTTNFGEKLKLALEWVGHD